MHLDLNATSSADAVHLLGVQIMQDLQIPKSGSPVELRMNSFRNSLETLWPVCAFASAGEGSQMRPWALSAISKQSGQNEQQSCARIRVFGIAC